MVAGVQETGVHRLMIHELLLFRFNSLQRLVSHTSTALRQPSPATSPMHMERINTENGENQKYIKGNKKGQDIWGPATIYGHMQNGLQTQAVRARSRRGTAEGRAVAGRAAGSPIWRKLEKDFLNP